MSRKKSCEKRRIADSHRVCDPADDPINLPVPENAAGDMALEAEGNGMKLFITLDMANDAFVENPSVEAARILRELAKRIENHPHFSDGHEQCLLDANGNEVGFADVVGDNVEMKLEAALIAWPKGKKA